MHSLKFKIISILLGTMLLLLACQAFFIGPHIKKKHIEESINMQNTISDQIAEEIDHSFRQAISEMEEISRLPGIISSNRGENDKIISMMSQVTPFFNYFFLMDKTGTWLSYPKRPHLVGKNIPKQNQWWVKETIGQKKTTFLNVVTATQIDKLVSGFATPVFPAAGKPEKLLRGVFVLSDDNMLLQTINKLQVGTRGYAFIVAQNGWVLAHPHLSQKPEHFTVYDYRAYLPVREVIGGKAGYAEYEYQDKRWLACYRPIQSTGWGVVVQQPVEDIYRPIERDMGLLLRLFIISFVLYALALIFGIRRTLNPLTELAMTISSRKGLRTDIHYANDEVGQLASRFRNIFKELQDSLESREESEAELLAYKESLEGKVARRTRDLQQEIDDRKKADAALRSSQERLSLLIAQSPLGIISWNLDFEIESWNPAAENIFGFSADEVSGKHAEIIIPQSSREQVDKVWQELVAMTGGSRNTNENITKEDKTIICKWYNTPFLDSSGQVMGVLSLVEDVTQMVRMEEDLLKARKLESLGILAGGIAHDFNNILAGILGNINLSLFDKDLGEKTKNWLIKAEKATIQATTLTQQLLTFAKGGEPVKEVTALKDIITDSASFVLHGDKVRCNFNIPEDLWAVDIDKGQISQVIQNIVLNASHSMPDGGTVEITCTNTTGEEGTNLPSSEDDRFVKITIRDDGIGIPAKVIERIFDPYFSTKQEGSGLGLAITHSIINKHGGYISVDSKVESGSIFTIYLPATTRPIEQITAKAEVDPQSSRAKVLMMDDDEVILDVARDLLDTMGHEFLGTKDGVEAISIFKEAANSDEPVDLVIMDLTIPGGMGGDEAIKEILAIDPDAKVIVSSGYANNAIMSSYEEYGFRGAVAKPYRLQELSRIINKVLGQPSR